MTKGPREKIIVYNYEHIIINIASFLNDFWLIQISAAKILQNHTYSLAMCIHLNIN